MQENDLTGAGPWTFQNPALEAGESWRVNLKTAEKGRYREYLPMDEILTKNYDTDNRITLSVNGVYSVDIDPNGKDSYGEVGIRLFQVTNEGSTAIDAGDVTISVKKDPWDADDAARAEKSRHPLENIGRNLIGL